MMNRMTMKKWLALDEEHQAVWWLWLDLRCWLQYQSEMLIDTEHFESSLPSLPAGSTLFYEKEARPRPYETSILFRSGTGDYRMHVIYDADLLSIRYTIDGDSHLHEVLAIVRNGDARFETFDCVPLTAFDLSLRMMAALTKARAC